MTNKWLRQFTNVMTCNIDMWDLYNRIYFDLVKLVKRSESAPPCNPERVEQIFLIPPKKLRNVYRSTSDSLDRDLTPKHGVLK